jgi:hypothetical protein
MKNLLPVTIFLQRMTVQFDAPGVYQHALRLSKESQLIANDAANLHVTTQEYRLDHLFSLQPRKLVRNKSSRQEVMVLRGRM